MTSSLQSLNDATASAGQQLSTFMASPEAKKLLPYLLSGGVGAAVGGAVTGKRRAREGEGRLSHLGRVLTNALLTGGLAAGGHALINKGLEKTVGTVDESNALAGEGGDQGPLATNLRDVAFSPITAAGFGAAGLGLTRNRAGIGSGTAAYRTALGELTKQSPAQMVANNAGDNRFKMERDVMGPDKDLRDGSPGKPIFSHREIDPKLERLTHRAGLVTAESNTLKGVLQRVTRQGPLSTFGRTSGRIAGRAGLGLAAASVPALVGALLTSENKSE